MSHTQEMGPQLSAARNKLLLKIHGTLLTGTIGLVLLVSVLFRKPLLLPFFQAFGQSGPNGTTLLDRAAIDPASRDANPGLPLPRPTRWRIGRTGVFSLSLRGAVRAGNWHHPGRVPRQSLGLCGMSKGFCISFFFTPLVGDPTFLIISNGSESNF